MRVVFLLIFSFVLLQADVYTQRLYETLFSSLFKTPVYVFTDKEAKHTLQKSRVVVIVNDCTQSDFLIGSNFAKLPKKCHNKPLFATSYKAYKQFKNSFGAFYWNKGRPQIHFNKSNLEKFSISLPNNLKKYLDEQ